ncbi:MAG: Na+/H+ antiporter NhaC family protein [Oscillospiraceae bacterium]|nr:Na+/H+ antiporter NhaC family protein [Oscillospiraceae bacterium]
MRTKKLVCNLLALAAAAALIILTILTPGQAPEDYSPGVYATALALLPPVIAIALALITKEVYSSLFVGVVVGALLYAGGNGELALNTLLFHESGGLVSGIADTSHACILVFVTLLGTLVVLMNRSGGAAAFGRWAQKRIKTRLGAQLLTILMGLLIFVDDGFNCMTVGSVMRPITDGHQVSRAKLAYLLDSTAAPVCIIAPISCWAAAVSYAVPEGMEINGFHMFIRTIPYNLYALATLVMLLLLVLLKLDFGPMRLHEANARKGDLFTAGDQPYEEPEDAEPGKGRISDLVIPVVVLILTCLLGMVYTGGLFSGASLIDAFADADSARGLVMGSLITVIITFWLYMNRGVISFKDFMGCFAAGFRSMCAPMIILILSWNLSGVTGLLGAADFIHGLMASSAEAVQMLIPAIAFIVSVFLAFSTGTSWGTFTILIPIVCAVFPGESEMLVISIAACLAGAVCGDHCSPISDTTIMSSAGAKSNHINHVTTQLPYALTAAAVCVPGYILAGIIGSRAGSAVAALATPVTLVLLLAVLLVIRRREGRKGEE